MGALKGNLPRKLLCIRLDGELFDVIQGVKGESGLSMSGLVELLILDGLKDTNWVKMQ
jgi:hypothetical protein